MSTDTMSTDAEVSIAVARAAGELLLELRDSYGTIDPHDRDRANALRKAADLASHNLIAGLLAEQRPGDALLSEEGKDDDSRLAADRVWIVDPLDGTYEYGQGRVDFAVHVALWHTGARQLSACTVDLPAQGLTRSVLDAGAVPAAMPNDRPIRIVASRSRPPQMLPAVVELLSAALVADGLTTHGVEIVDVGSVGAKVNELLCGRAEAYVHDTGFFEWDVAAPLGVARHYGYDAVHVGGDAVQFNRMPPFVPSLVVAHPALSMRLHRAIAEAAR